MRNTLYLLVILSACGGDDSAPDTGGTDAGATDSGDFDGGGDGSAGRDAGPVPRLEQYIRDDLSARLVFEVDSFPGNAPSAGVQSDFVTSVRSIVDKPGGVEVVLDGTLEAHPGAWTLEELRTLAEETRDLDVGADAIGIHILYVDGRFEIDGVLGAAFTDRDLVIFRDRIDQQCDSAGIPLMREQLCQTAEVTILVHEFGHLLGLVNRGLPMVADHEDPEHPGHDVDPDCVMYYAFDGASAFDSLLTRFLGGDTEPLAFCGPSRDDVNALRDR